MSTPAEAGMIEVLLATYNGERFLRQQIDSILAQDYPALRILARDDGSTDGTVSLLEEYARLHPARFSLLPKSAPTGSAKMNFVALFQASTAGYVCCADQDDFWLPHKLSHTMQALLALEAQHGPATPLLIFTDLAVVDADLQPLHPSFWVQQGVDPTIIQSFSHLLTQNVVTGCTTLFNRALCVLAARMPADAYMHDWWLALVACAMGQTDYLPEKTVLYRQHGGNVLGAVAPDAPRLVPRFRYHDLRRAQWEMSDRQARAMLELFGDRLPLRNRRLLEAFLRCGTSDNRVVRVATMLRYRFFRKGLRPKLAMLWYLWDLRAAKRGASA